MAWQAVLEGVSEVSEQQTDSVWIDVTFSEPDSGRSFRQSLKLVSTNVNSEQKVQELLAARVADLDALDVTADVLRDRIGEVLV